MPLAPPTLTPLPTPPTTADPVNFDARMDGFLSALPTLQTQQNALSANVYANAQEVKAYADDVYINTVATASNAAQAAQYAGAAPWVSGTTYALGFVAWSPANRRLYRRLIAGAGTTDPSADATNWGLINPGLPYTPVTGTTQAAAAGGAYALTNATAQGSATNLMLYSNALNNPAWIPMGTANIVPNSDWDYAGNLQAVSLALPTLGDRLYSPTISVSASTAYTVSIWLRGSGVIYLAGTGSGGTGVTFVSPITLTSTLTRYSVTLTTLAGATSLFFMIGTYNPITGPAGTATGAYVSGLQVETGSVATSDIPTTSTPVTRPAGVIAPQRIVLPASPNSNNAVSVLSANESAENIIDPNGQKFYGPSGPLAGPLTLDSKNAAVDLQFINGYWRLV